MLKLLADAVFSFDVEWIPDPKAGEILHEADPSDAPGDQARAAFETLWASARSEGDEPDYQPYLKTILCRIVSLAGILRDHATLRSLCGNTGHESELNVEGDEMSAEDAIMLAPEIVANGALETITFGNKQAVTMKTDMTEAEFSGKMLGASGAIIVAAFLPKCK